MSDYKRLTDEDWLTTISINDTNDAKLIEYALRLWQLENKIENCTLIELPYLHHHKENINGLNYEFWQVVFRYEGTMLTTKEIYDKAEAEAELARIRGQK